MRCLAMRDVAVVTILIAALLHEATAQFSVDKAMAQISGRDVKQADKWALQLNCCQTLMNTFVLLMSSASASFWSSGDSAGFQY